MAQILISVKEALQKAASMLAFATENPKKEAMILLHEYSGKGDIFLITNEDFKIDTGFFELVKKRAQNVPLEYITKKVSFYSREFSINEGVLIPRPETEILVDKAVSLIRETGAVNVAEIGIGSGVVSVMLATLLPNITIDASDISAKAIKLSKTNAKNFGVEDKINFHLTSYLAKNSAPEVIVSNPPYISTKEKLEKHVLKEPRKALFGGTEGDEIIKKIVLLSQKIGSHLVCEIGYDQKSKLEKFFADVDIKNYSFYKDLSGFDRGFVIKKGEK